jgi:hypothetical protein
MLLSTGYSVIFQVNFAPSVDERCGKQPEKMRRA